MDTPLASSLAPPPPRPAALRFSAASAQAISYKTFPTQNADLCPRALLRTRARRSAQESFGELNERVQRDLQDMERVFQLEKERKQLGVMRGLLRKAFPEAEVRRRAPRSLAYLCVVHGALTHMTPHAVGPRNFLLLRTGLEK